MFAKAKFPSRKLILAVFACATFLSAYFLAVAQDGPPTGGTPAQAGQRGRFAAEGFERVAGTIESIQPDSIMVKTEDGKTVTVQLNGETRFRKDRQPAKVSDFGKGDQVFIGAQAANGDPTKLVARFVGSGRPGGMRMGMGQPPTAEQMQQMGLGTKFIAGEVKAIDAPKLTILRPDGQTQVIQADENTSFQNGQRESITMADIKVGDHVMGRGEMKDGVFVPSTLRVGMPHFAIQPPEPSVKP